MTIWLESDELDTYILYIYITLLNDQMSFEFSYLDEEEFRLSD